MGEEWDQLFHQNSITRVENDDADFNYSSSEDDEADNNSTSCDAAPQNHIKGLSKFYQGKSQSFTSFSGITCVNDLAKKVISPAIKRKIKQSRSYAVGLDANDTHKLGLSKFYQGKSQSFTSFSGITCVNDLAKKVISPAIKRKIKQRRSYAVGLDANDTHKLYSKPASSDKNLKGSCAFSVARTNLLPPSIPMHKNM